jgi:Cu+-exporting ATPase
MTPMLLRHQPTPSLRASAGGKAIQKMVITSRFRNAVSFIRIFLIPHLTKSLLPFSIVKTGEESMKNTLQFKIIGMHCVTCASRIERAIASVEGVQKAEVNFINEKAHVELDPSFAAPTKNILQAIDKEGYKAKLLQDKHTSSHHHNEVGERNYMDLAIAILFTLPLIAHMLGFHIHPYIQLFCASVVQFWSGRRFYKAAWRSLKHLRGDMDLLVTIGTSAAYGYSLMGVLLQSNALYFEAASVVITLVLLGRFLEDRAKHSATAAVRSLMNLTPPKALVEKDGAYIEVLSHDIKRGDHIMVRAWQRIPVDGLVFQGESEVNEAMITGESLPVLKIIGSNVTGGTTNTDGILYIEATTVGNQSTLSRMIHLVEQAQSSNPPIQKFVDRVSEIFVPLVLLTSLVTLAGWILVGADFSKAFMAAVSVLVVACPCALGLATPTAIVVSMGAAARKGVLIKDLESLEVLRKVDQVVFDKTGTLTKGEFSLTSFKTLSDIPQDELLRIAASLQKGSEHPLANAFVKAYKAHTFLEVSDFTSLPGKGIQGILNGRIYYLGSWKLMNEKGISTSSPQKGDQTVVYLAEDNRLLGIFYLADTPRKRAFETIQFLKNMGLKTIMLTGDNRDAAQTIASKVGIDDVQAQLQPQDKINYIRALEQRHHSIAMVGDGVNDGPALAAATVGFAMGSGTDVAMDAAPITLMRPALELIPQTFILARKTFRVIQENLFWAFIFNVIGIGFAAFGHLSPELAGGAMAASSLMVVLNSLRLKWA